MKKKIFIGLSIFSLFFLLGGIYIITTIETVTSRLDNLIMLHQVEMLREHLLIQIKSVQTDLSVKNTRYERDINTINTHVRDMEDTANTCFECHHSENVLSRLKDLRDGIEKYKDAVSMALIIRANVSRLEAETDSAFKVGEELITEVNDMIAITTIKLKDKTHAALREIADTKIILYILVALGPLSTAGLAFIFIKGFTKPVSALLDATRKLKGGNLDYRIEDLKDEFGEVAASFNEMAGSLREQMLKMQRTEQMAVLGELAAGLAHEIKNPLAGIKISVEMFSEELNMSEEDRAVILKVIDEIKRIELLIKNLLNFAKPSEPQLAVVDMNDLIDKTVAFSLKYPSLSSNTSTKISVSKDFDKRLPEIMADPMQLQQAFLNLLLNAIDAMKDGGTLAVKTSYAAEVNAIQIDISDTGRGIAEELRDKIFKPFFTTKSKGTGLGLAITKRLIEQHEGVICVEKKSGRGAIFHISLPVKQVEKGQAT